MMTRILAAGLVVAMMASPLFAAGGTMTVASEGREAHVRESWPEGVGEIVNDPARTDGWNSWFTEWPNDVNQYAFRIESIDDVNRLIEKIAAVDSPLKRIHLSPLKEPRALGWVHVLPERNRIPVIFSIGDQSIIDQWYERVRKPFGVMEFLDTPVAVPPTLTLFIGNDAIKLDELEIPPEMTVVISYVPTVFLHSNTTIEREREQEAGESGDDALRESLESLDDETRAVAEEILSFLEAREAE